MRNHVVDFRRARLLSLYPLSLTWWVGITEERGNKDGGWLRKIMKYKTSKEFFVFILGSINYDSRSSVHQFMVAESGNL